jgi:hypothetical protein
MTVEMTVDAGQGSLPTRQVVIGAGAVGFVTQVGKDHVLFVRFVGVDGVAVLTHEQIHNLKHS